MKKQEELQSIDKSLESVSGSLESVNKSLESVNESLENVSESMTEYARLLNEVFYHLTADYRAENPEANEAFFEQYPEQRKHTQLTIEDIEIRDRIEKEYK